MSLETFWHLQAALHSRLSSHAPLAALLAAGANSIFDHVPVDSAFPYIALGEMEARPANTQGENGYEVDMTLHCYSRSAGMREIKKIMAATSDALLSGSINVAGHVMVLCQERQSAARLENDGETRHGQQTFRLVVEPAL